VAVDLHVVVRPARQAVQKRRPGMTQHNDEGSSRSGDIADGAKASVWCNGVCLGARKSAMLHTEAEGKGDGDDWDGDKKVTACV
jgi:hypothetical protein